MGSMQAALAISVGYLLGRRRTRRVAMVLAAAGRPVAGWAARLCAAA